MNGTSGRSSGTATSLGSARGLRAAGRARRALREFLGVPTVMAVGFVALAALSIVLDQTQAGPVRAVRHLVSHVIGDSAAGTALNAIATGLITVTSITFSVLLLAVQQTATSLSPVVFDQFLRRRANQVYLGFFVGLALYSYLVLAAVQDGTPPVLGATIAVVLTAVALGFLLILVYSTIDQMRATNVVTTMREHALAAHSRDRELIHRTRRTSVLEDAVTATCCSQVAGYVTGIDIDRIHRAIAGRERSEVSLHVSIGDFVAHDEAVATVKDGDEAYAQEVADEIRRAVSVSRNPDLDLAAATGVVELANIGWTSLSTAKHNPLVGMQAIDALRELIGVWQSERRNVDGPPDDEVLPIVYRDVDEDTAFDSLFSLLVVAAESHQHQSAAHVLEAYAWLLPRLTEEAAARVADDLRRGAGTLGAHSPGLVLERAVVDVCDALEEAGQRGEAAQLRSAWHELAGPRSEPRLRSARSG